MISAAQFKRIKCTYDSQLIPTKPAKFLEPRNQSIHEYYVGPKRRSSYRF